MTTMTMVVAEALAMVRVRGTPSTTETSRAKSTWPR